MSRRAQALKGNGEIRTEMASDTENPIDIADPFARRLITQYLERRKADVARLRAALESDDFDLIRVTGHNMSGSGGAYGLDKVSEFGKTLEEAAIAADGQRISELIDRLDHFLATVRLT